MSEKLSGIERAVIQATGNREFVQLLRDRTDIQITERTLSYWRRVGYVPTAYVTAVSKAFDIPIDDLARLTPRKRKAPEHAGTNGSATDQR